VVNSSVTREAVWAAYGIDAEILPPPPALVPGGEESTYYGVEPGFVLCVSRLLPYKNVDAVVRAMRLLPMLELVVVGEGPQAAALIQLADEIPNVKFTGRVADSQLRWLYRNAAVLVGASLEDYGLTPLEASSFGRPVAVLRRGGYLDTVIEGTTGLFFDDLTPTAIATAVRAAVLHSWNVDVLMSHAARFSADRFRAELVRIVGEEQRCL
jgi:glycosyltransferase involved in cell wall biosynthesis